jgi:hypothetical protein
MAILVQTITDALPFVGKKIFRISISSCDAGLHFNQAQDEILLLDSYWELLDASGKKIDQSFGLALRQTSQLSLLFNRHLRKIDSAQGVLTLVFDEYSIKTAIIVNYRSASVVGKRSLDIQKAFRWDPLTMTASGSLLGQKKGKAHLIYKLQDLLNKPALPDSFYGQAIIRIGWSQEDISLYFYGNQTVLIFQPWILFDLKGEKIDSKEDIKERSQTVLFRLVGLKVERAELEVRGTRIIFEGGLVLQIITKQHLTA